MDGMKDLLQSLIEIHGAEIPFAPEPLGSVIEPEKPSIQDEASAAKTVGQKSCSSTTASSHVLLPHKFLFLQRSNGADWTAVQALGQGKNRGG